MSEGPPRILFNDRLGVSVFSCLSMIGGGAVIIWPAQAFFGWAMLVVGSAGLAGTLGHLAWTHWAVGKPAALAIAGLVGLPVLFVISYWSGYRSEQAKQTLQEAVKLFDVPKPASPSAQVDGKQERVVLNVDLPFLINLYRDRTGIEADRMFSVYIHKWIRVVGKVSNVTQRIGGKDYLVILEIPQTRLAALTFSGNWTDRVSVMRLGEDISAFCRVSSASTIAVSLDECEIVSADQIK